MKTPTKRVTRRLAASLAIITALATTGAWAANTWLDETKTLDANWPVSGFLALGQNSTDTGILNIGSDSASYDLSVASHLIIGHSGHGELYLNSGNVNACTSSGNTYIGNNGGSTGLVVVNGGKFTSNGDLLVGNSGTGTLTINGGTVEVGSSSSQKWTKLGIRSGTIGTINLNGGQLKLWHVRKDGSGTASFVFNGGTLVANGVAATDNGLIYSNLPVTVNPGGGTIDNGGLSVAINAAISGTGGLTFTGSGTTTLNGAVSYSGATAVTLGTTLAVANETAKNNILSHGLVVVGVPTATGQTVMTYTSDLTGSDLSKVKCSLAPDTEFEIGGDGNKSILVKTVGATLDNYWTGAANDGNLSNAANWSSGVPSGNANIFCTNSVTLTKGATFAPSSITFLEGSAKVTIVGDAITGIAAITNLSSVRHVFNCAVSGSEIDFYNSVLCCDFNGGITLASATFAGTASDQAKGLVGKWHFTGGWTPVSNNRIYGNSSVTVDGELLNPNNMTIDSGAVVTAATMKATMSSNAYSAYNNSGRLVITGMMDIQATSDFLLARQDSQNATIIVGGIVYNTSSWSWLNAKTLVVGEDGINFDSSHYNSLRFSNTAGVTLYARDKTLTLGHEHDGMIQRYAINDGTTLTVCTTQFESDERATVYVNGKIVYLKDSNNNWAGGMAVTGNGTLVFNSESTFSGGMTVGDTATVKVNAGCTPGSGVITLGAGTTLALTATGNTFSPIANTLNLPTEGTATIRIDGARLKSGDNIIATTVGNAATTDNVTLDENSTALAGRKASLSVEDGKLHLNIKSTGTIFIIR